MSYKRHQVIIDYINVFMRFLIAYVTMIVFLYPFDKNAPIQTLILLPAPYISYFIRRYARHVWSFVVLHLVLIALYLLTTDKLYYIVIYGIFLLTVAAASYYIKQKLRGRTNTSLFFLLYFIFIYIACYMTGIKELLPYCFAIANLYTLLHLLNIYLLNLDKFVRNHEYSANLPFIQIKNTNHLLIAFLCCLVLLAMLIFSQLPIQIALSAIGALLVKLLHALAVLLRFFKSDDKLLEEEPRETPPELPPMETSRFMEILGIIVYWMATIAIILGLVAVILYTIYKIYQYFYIKNDAEVKDEVVFLSPFIKSEHISEKSKKFTLPLFGHSNNNSIRKHFAKAVSSNNTSDSEHLKNLTPSQLSKYAISKPEEILSAEDERSKQLTSFYEKARYSNEQCTKEEVKLVKKLLQK